jgi:hypothetical protein
MDKTSADTAGPMPTSSQGNRFFTVLVDRASKFARSISTATKGDAGLHIVTTLSALQLASGKILCRYQSDGAKELYLGAVQTFLQQQGPINTVTVPNGSAMNGQAERRIQTIRTAARNSLLASELTTQHWDYAVLDATDRHNVMHPIGSIASPAETFHQHSTDQHDI